MWLFDPLNLVFLFSLRLHVLYRYICLILRLQTWCTEETNITQWWCDGKYSIPCGIQSDGAMITCLFLSGNACLFHMADESKDRFSVRTRTHEDKKCILLATFTYRVLLTTEKWRRIQSIVKIRSFESYINNNNENTY